MSATSEHSAQSELSRSQTFERRLGELLHASAGADEAEDRKFALDALQRLVGDPSLRVLAEPDGPVLYEDPILDSAWACSEAIAMGAIAPAAEGEDLDRSLIHWIPAVLPLIRGRLSRTRDVLESKVPNRDIQLETPVRLAIFGDGGYRGLAQRRVLTMIEQRQQQMIEQRPQQAGYSVAVHLGDTYHAGSEAQMLRHLIVPLTELRQRLGARVTVLSLCGNHDLYAGPDGFLAAMTAFGQPGRYCAIETAAWRIACLDSASGDTSRLCMHGAIDPVQLQWIEQKQADQKRLIILTHHVPLSAWYSPDSGLLDQLRSLSGLVAWYWGHEHRSAAYAPIPRANFLGGCVGNGAFLEEWRAPAEGGPTPLAWYPEGGRCTCYGEAGTRYWPHGYLELELREDGGVERFYLEGQRNTVFERNLL